LPTHSESAGELSKPSAPPLSAQAVPFDAIASQSEPPKKNKGGRPSKEEVARREAARRAAEAQSPQSADALFTSNATTVNPAGASSAIGAPAPITTGIPHEVIRNGLEMPFAMAAAKTGFAGFALKKDESDPLVPMADMVMVKWLPTIGPYGVEMMFCGSILALAGVKYMAYLDFKKEQKNVSRMAGSDRVPQGGGSGVHP